jgi:ABC-type branched-subunit amino acid transport system ATPase component
MSCPSVWRRRFVTASVPKIRSLSRDHGVAVFAVEQQIRRVAHACDCAVIKGDGRCSLELDARDLMSREAEIDAQYFGAT